MRACKSRLGSSLFRTSCISFPWMALVVATAILALAGFAMSQTIVYRTLKRNQIHSAFPGNGLVASRWSDGSAGAGYVRPDPNYKPSRTPDGQPDIQGIWAVGTGLEGNAEASAGDQGTVSADRQVDPARANTPAPKSTGWVVDPPGGRIPFQPWARAKLPYVSEHYIFPLTSCLPAGVPLMMTYVDFQIIQVPGEVLAISEHVSNFRHILLDGRSHVGKNLKLYVGDSRGHWEGNTLVIDVTNQNDKTYAALGPIFHSDKLHVTERLTAIDADTLQYEATLDDPEVYQRPWKMAFPMVRTPDKQHPRAGLDTYEMLEEYCAEGNRSVDTLLEIGWKLYTGIGDVTDSSR